MASPGDAMTRGMELMELRRLDGRVLDPLLLEETVEWQRELDWDFSRAADLVRQFLDMRGLSGFALLDRGEVVGYTYSVLEDYKGMVGDLYLRPDWRNVPNQERLFRKVFDDLIATPGVRRIESQLMLVDPATGRSFQQDRFVRVRERILMRTPSSANPTMAPGPGFRRFRVEPWADLYHEPAAGVIASAYRDHLDGQINDQYRTLAGARRFLYNIIQFPGCGTFFRPASFVALNPANGVIAGIALTSFVEREVGHITQLAVTPEMRGQGLGYELLRRAVTGLREHGARRVSLTVTAANREAIRLYERCGFAELRRFPALMWDAL